ncbi:MAG: tryptophan-rich sensory protein [Caldilineaceae bacterium]|nr:tryptophan-rich sensory protein [Caldilineaceae bacterium]
MADLTETIKSTLQEQRETLIDNTSIDQATQVHWRSLLLALAAPFTAALIGSIAAGGFRTGWYRTIKKPSWNPPSWLFGPVWTVLYALMGIASWLVWREGESKGWRRFATPWRHPQDEQVKGALRLYGVHLVFNALWSVLFFGRHRIGLALGEVTVLWALILSTLVRFSRIRPLAGLLLVPYQLWVTFATILNFRIWQLNRGRQ